MIPPETIERIRETVDLVSVIGEHVQLKRAGGDFRGPCPFHGGKNPNFSVSTRRNSYHCFKCGVSGDVYTFLQQHLGMDWITAVRTAADKAGITIVEVRGPRDQQKDVREPLWALMGSAVEVMRDLLWSDVGREAQGYLAGRGIDQAAADKFQIGFAPTDGQAVIERLTALGYTTEQLVTTGMLVRREEDGAVRPRFRGRVMFPIHDPAGHPVGFGGRLLGPGEPKYLNSSESPVFSKGKLLYALHLAKNTIRKDDRAVVVEGYMDVIRCHLAGVTAAVAGLGTALTSDQAALLTRYSRHVHLLYDSDAAGQKATFRAGLELLQQKADVHVVTLPDGDDPDTFVRAHGRAGLEQRLATGTDLLERQVQLLESRGWFADLSRARRAIDKLVITLRATADDVTKALYVTRVAAAAGVEPSVIERQMNNPEAMRRASRVIGPRTPAAPAPDVAPNPSGDEERPARSRGRGMQDEWAARSGPPPLDEPPPRYKRRAKTGWRMLPGAPDGGARLRPDVELTLVALLLEDRGYLAEAVSRVAPQELRQPALRQVYESIIRLGSAAALDDIELDLSAQDDPDLMDVFHEIQERAHELVPHSGRHEHFRGIATEMRVRSVDGSLADLDEAIRRASVGERRALERERETLKAEKRTLLAARR
jgi:DNA primase